MSLKPEVVLPVPEETIHVAQAAFPQGNPYMRMRDALGTFYEDTQFAALFCARGQPALSPWRLALVTIMQFAENLTDRQAADAVRARIDWKYALGLELTDPGFHYSVLSEFRSRLIEGNAEHLVLETMLTHFQEQGLLKAKGKQRTDSTHVLAAIRTMNRLEVVAETMLHTLNVLATVAGDWLKAWVPREWFDRYEKRLDEYRLPQEPKERIQLAEMIGVDGHHLLTQVSSDAAPQWLRSLPAIDTMRQIWLQQFLIQEGKVHWRTKENVPPSALMLSSPHDPQARYSSKRNMHWIGYKVHLTETCDVERPHLITRVQTTLATEPDSNLTATIHEELKEQQLLPQEHLADTGYAAADLMLECRKEHGLDMVCPLRPDNSWQARTKGAFDISQFEMDWEHCQVTCPESKVSRYWKLGKRGGRDKILVGCDPADCQACPSRCRCTRSKGTRNRPGSREITLAVQEEHEMLQQARQQTEAFKERYTKRAGVEGTISQAASALSMRRCRYRGLKKTHLQHVLTACAINLTRGVDWLSGKPRAKTRVSPFIALAA